MELPPFGDVVEWRTGRTYSLLDQLHVEILHSGGAHSARSKVEEKSDLEVSGCQSTAQWNTTKLGEADKLSQMPVIDLGTRQSSTPSHDVICSVRMKREN